MKSQKNRHYWLLKSEPCTFSIDDLAQAPQQTTYWEGVRNYQARNFMRAMQPGDLAFFYHSSCPIPAIMGIVTIIKGAEPDSTAYDPHSVYYDPKAMPDAPRWSVVSVQLTRRFSIPLTREVLKTAPSLANMPLLQRGNRLSVLPITLQAWQTILSMAK